MSENFIELTDVDPFFLCNHITLPHSGIAPLAIRLFLEIRELQIANRMSTAVGHIWQRETYP